MAKVRVHTFARSVIPLAALCLLGACATSGAFTQKVAAIEPGETKASVIQRLGQPGNRQFEGANEALQWCEKTLGGLFGGSTFTVVYLFSGRVTAVKSYSAVDCTYQTINWQDAPGRPGDDARTPSTGSTDRFGTVRSVAELGSDTAQYDLGVMYATGSYGAPHDDAEAVKWFRKAAEQGLARAQYNLGFMYLSGRGVAKDLVQAYVWTQLSAARLQGDDPKQRAKTNVELALSEMTQAQISEAKRLIAAWKPTKP